MSEAVACFYFEGDIVSEACLLSK